LRAVGRRLAGGWRLMFLLIVFSSSFYFLSLAIISVQTSLNIKLTLKAKNGFLRTIFLLDGGGGGYVLCVHFSDYVLVIILISEL